MRGFQANVGMTNPFGGSANPFATQPTQTTSTNPFAKAANTPSTNPFGVSQPLAGSGMTGQTNALTGQPMTSSLSPNPLASSQPMKSSLGSVQPITSPFGGGQSVTSPLAPNSAGFAGTMGGAQPMSVSLNASQPIASSIGMNQAATASTLTAMQSNGQSVFGSYASPPAPPKPLTQTTAAQQFSITAKKAVIRDCFANLTEAEIDQLPTCTRTMMDVSACYQALQGTGPFKGGCVPERPPQIV